MGGVYWAPLIKTVTFAVEKQKLFLHDKEICLIDRGYCIGIPFLQNISPITDISANRFVVSNYIYYLINN